ncbi:hypothetical protein L1987_43178 [Smallanthus sonchifolius]|uniref:Uncharacterized protein n=1 Tax=Smallanthus sonchifolius TaxID=185202 RepID=A0ACB9GLL7_9ASTR|nr:hypothetical protein L1987_43178 [Smallanthus sonchifolius]
MVEQWWWCENFVIAMVVVKAEASESKLATSGSSSFIAASIEVGRRCKSNLCFTSRVGSARLFVLYWSRF